MLATKMMPSKVHDAGGTAWVTSASGKTDLEVRAEDPVRRYFSRSLDSRARVGLSAWGLDLLCLQPELRVLRMCYTCELMTVSAGLLMFFVSSWLSSTRTLRSRSSAASCPTPRSGVCSLESAAS
ncbi:hypothetical protein N9L76_06770 [bacterium]|nr:hypothetical protein [bacterium]